MTVINHKSISGITSITTPAGSDDLLTVHTNNQTERLRITSAGKVGIGTDNPKSKFDVRPGGHSGDGAITFNTGLGEVGSSNNAIQSINGTGSALQPLGYRATEHIFATQTAERFRIKSDGNVLVGNFTPVDTRNTGGIHIQDNHGISFKAHSSGTSRNWRIRNDDWGWGNLDFGVGTSNSDWSDVAGETVLSLTSSRRVGINEVAPDAPLHITGGLPHIRLENSGTSASAGDILGQIDFKHNDSDDAGVTAAIKCIAEDAAGNSYLTFNNGDGGNADERLRITSAGEVLIGRTSKANDINKLVVTGTSPADNYDSQLLLEGSETSGAVNTGGALSFGGHDGSTARNWGNIFCMKENGTGGNRASYMAFHTRPDGGVVTENLRITSGGALLVGTISPYYGSGDMQHEIKKNNSRTYTAPLMTGHSHLFLHNSDTTDNCFTSLGFRAGSGDGSIGYVYRGSANNSDFVINTDGNGNGVERLRVFNGGSVLIGSLANEAAGGATSTGSARLVIDCEGLNVFDGVGAASNYGLVFANDPTTNKANGIGFFNDSGTAAGGYIVHQDKGGNNIGDLVFGTASTADSPTEKLRITSNGAVGIGTDNPDETLELFKASGSNFAKISTRANSTIGIELEKTGATTQSWRIADGQTVNGTLEFYDKTEGETRLAIDGSSRVIIGQASHNGGGALVVCGNANTPNSYAAASFCRIQANPTSGTTLTNLRFSGGSGGTNRAAEITVKCDANWSDGSSQASKMTFGVTDSGGTSAGNPSLTLKAGGDVEINRGNLVMANDKGISFLEADDTATGETVSSSVLDDYEEGSCVMNYSPASGSFAAHIYTSGKYVKIGRMVTVTGSISLNGAGSSSGRVDIIGWPYAPTGLNSTWSLESGHGVIKGHYGYPDEFNMLVMNNGGTNAYIYKENGTYMDRSNMSTGYNECQCSFTVTYYANA